jgi:hypothetical protein
MRTRFSWETERSPELTASSGCRADTPLLPSQSELNSYDTHGTRVPYHRLRHVFFTVTMTHPAGTPLSMKSLGWSCGMVAASDNAESRKIR